MKRYILGFVLLVALAVSAAAAPLMMNEAYVLLNALPVYQDTGSKLTWLESLTIGDKVTLLNKTSKFKLEGAEREYVRIKAPDGKEGWVRTPYVAAKASLAVVKADQAVVYTEPREVKITDKYVSRMTLVAILQDGSTGGFARIQCYDRAQKWPFTDAAYVSMDDLTAADADVNAVILYVVAVENPKVKANLLKVAMTKYNGTMFLADLQAAAGVAPVVAKETTPASGTYVVNVNNVNVRSAPDEKSGQVIGRLNQGAQVEVTEMTTQTYTVGANVAAWFHASTPDGWIFGSFLDPAE